MDKIKQIKAESILALTEIDDLVSKIVQVMKNRILDDNSKPEQIMDLIVKLEPILTDLGDILKNEKLK